jgi:predicted RNA binding protein YcfA (HicA-like mRNA interferase family)
MVNFINRQSDSNSQTSLSSATTTSTSRSSKASSSSSYDPPTLKGAHYSVISDLRTEPETKSMAERSVTNETLTSAVKVDETPDAATIETAEVKKKKKKKKKKATPEQQTETVGKLGASIFGLSGLMPSTAIQTSSLFLQPHCPKFNEEEQKIFKALLKESVFFENTNLLEVFMTDFHHHIENLRSLCGSYDNRLLTFFEALSEKSNIVKTIFIFEIYLKSIHRGKNTKIYFSTGSKRVEGITGYDYWLQNCLVDNLNYIEEVIKTFTPPGLKSVKNSFVVNKICKSRSDAIAKIELLQKKIKFFLKFIQAKDCKTLCFDTKISSWSESIVAQTNGLVDLNKITKLNSFIKEIFSFEKNLSLNNSVGRTLQAYLKAVDQILQGKLDKRLLVDFMISYKNFTICKLQRCEFVKAESFKLENLGEVHPENGTTIEDQRHGLDLFSKENPYFREGTSLDLLDKWVSDLYHTVCSQYAVQFNEAYVNAPQAYIKRLLIMLDLINSESLGVEENPVESEKISKDPFLKKLQEQIQKLTSESLSEYQDVYHDHCIEIEEHLALSLASQPFQLSKCMKSLSYISKKISRFQPKFKLDQMREMVLQIVRDAKQNHEIDDRKVSELKQEIQDIISRESFQLCVYMMMSADIQGLSSQSHSYDFMQLLPHDLVRWLALDGFDKIFSKAAAVVIADNIEGATPAAIQENAVQFHQEPLPSIESKKQNEPLEKPKNGKNVSPPAASKKLEKVAKKEPEMPQRQDFVDTTSKNVIVRFVEMMGYAYKRTGRHHVYEHQQTGGKVIVPNSVEAVGTRLSIFRQAFFGSRPQEGKGD